MVDDDGRSETTEAFVPVAAPVQVHDGGDPRVPERPLSPRGSFLVLVVVRVWRVRREFEGKKGVVFSFLSKNRKLKEKTLKKLTEPSAPLVNLAPRLDALDGELGLVVEHREDRVERVALPFLDEAPPRELRRSLFESCERGLFPLEDSLRDPEVRAAGETLRVLSQGVEEPRGEGVVEVCDGGRSEEGIVVLGVDG